MYIFVILPVSTTSSESSVQLLNRLLCIDFFSSSRLVSAGAIFAGVDAVAVVVVVVVVVVAAAVVLVVPLLLITVAVIIGALLLLVVAFVDVDVEDGLKITAGVGPDGGGILLTLLLGDSGFKILLLNGWMESTC